MRSTRTWVTAGTLVVLTATLAVLVPLNARARTSPDNAVLALVALSRSQARLPSVYSAPGLDAIARRQSERMRSAGRIFHNPRLPEDLNAARIGWTIAGENVGVGPTVQDVHRAFMASPTHRANILGRSYDAVGVSVSRTTDGTVYVTQVFARLVRPSCDRFLIAEDGSRVRPSFYGAAC